MAGEIGTNQPSHPPRTEMFVNLKLLNSAKRTRQSSKRLKETYCIHMTLSNNVKLTTLIYKMIMSRLNFLIVY